ncbi:hypothetical protein [Actinokineospora globicatena]|uniref:Uncharacterized protein n=1 Tax=Actinokineospora globicatena TaxID=103729 RepID=A0A9W6V5C8_9PSEU|nr:hypothetical protein [Actinokineospora globicatena]GLW89282.1 hypothetical protein Aglo03_00980 [Actinokineospora globicatena]
MGVPSPVHVDGAAGQWALWQPDLPNRGWEPRLGVLFGFGAATGLVMAPVSDLGAWALLLVAPLGAFGLVARRARRKRAENTLVLRSADFDEDSADLANRLVIALATLMASRTAVAGWLPEDTLVTAHRTVWSALGTLRETAGLRALLRESHRYPELADDVAAKQAELTAVLDAVTAVATRMDGVLAALSTAEHELATAEAEQARAHQVAQLRERLSGTPTPLAPRQVDLDAIAAAVAAAAEILSVD